MIPKVIHYCWFGGNPLPELAIKCIESWKKYLPDYEIKEWNESNFDVNIVQYTKEAYECKKYAFVSDYARFWILYKYGGLYFDTDVEVIKPIDDIIERGPFMGCEKESQNGAVATVAPGLGLGVNPGLGLGVNPGLGLYKELLDEYATIRFCVDGTMNQRTIVEYTTDLLCKKYGLKATNEIQQCEGIFIYPKEYFAPLGMDGVTMKLTENSRSIHHYTASWSDRSSVSSIFYNIKNDYMIPLIPNVLTNSILTYKKAKRDKEFETKYRIKMNLRILWVNPSFLDYRVPLYDEINKLYEGSFHILYSCKRMTESVLLKVQTALGSNAHGLKQEKLLKFGERSDFANTAYMIPFPKGLYKQIKEINPDVLVGEGFFQFTPFALLYSIIHHKPLLIAYERTAHTERNCPWHRRLYRRIISHFVKGYLANGIETKKYLISQGVDEAKIFTGMMCADSNWLADSCKNYNESERNDLRCKYINSDNGLLFVYVGQLNERKGVEYLLQGWQRHIQAYPLDKLLVIGTGPLECYLKDNYGKVNGIIFEGFVSYNSIYKYYAIADVFVIPTLEDNWSLVVPEAMATGLPIACSIYNGCYPELVQEGRNGKLFDPLNIDSVVEMLAFFHTVELGDFGKESITIESQFNPKSVAVNFKNAIDQLMSVNN